MRSFQGAQFFWAEMKKINLLIIFLGRIKISKNPQIFSSILENFRTPSTTALGIPYFSKALVLPGAFPYT
jgi:hypothetical protein